MFGGGYQDQAPISYDKEARKVGFASNADWKAEGGMAKPMNGGPAKVDTYAKKQQQLSSSVFEQTDYAGYAPISKKKVDIDNVGHQNKSVAKGRKTDDVLKAGSKGFEPVKKDYANYNATGAKQSNLSSGIFGD